MTTQHAEADQPYPYSVAEIQEKSIATRRAVISEIAVAGSGHYGSVFSAVEIFTSLYYGFLRIRPEEPNWGDRDRLVLSKGHACSGIYPILADLGYFPAAYLETFTRLGSRLGDHPDMRKVPGFDFSAGSLGHGLAIGAGIAEAQRLRGSASRTVVIMGDGEQNEGQIWEAGAYAGARRLGNMLGIIDVNQVSVDGPTKEVLDMQPLGDKWRAFGWLVEEVNGHDIAALLAAYGRYDARRAISGAPPTMLIANTVSGKGVSFIEGMAEWHVGYLHGLDVERALRDIDSMFEVSK